jgi:molybdopterin synthase sulfur carrier subunit
MTIKLLAFGIAKDILGAEKNLITFNGATVGELKIFLCEKYPQFARLKTFALAVNLQYADDSLPIKESDEIAVIPPVSGG